MKITLGPARWLWRLVGRLWRRNPRRAEMLSLTLLREATDCERRARDYDLSDPYLAGKNSGRAEMLRRWSLHLSSPNDGSEQRARTENTP